MLKVFKFGGASVKDAQSVKNVIEIIRTHGQGRLVMVLSAMGKMTNAFEKLVQAYAFGHQDLEEQFHQIKEFHLQIINNLFPNSTDQIFIDIDFIFDKLKTAISEEVSDNFDYEYDRIVPLGELLSTTILSAYLNYEGIKTALMDSRKLIKTDHTHRSADINWELTQQKILKKFDESFWQQNDVGLVQGFIGSTRESIQTTLGREGSDFTASIFAYVMNATELTIWKDVPGLLNADPKVFNETVLLENISFQEAIELSYYGAKIIHPKTIKPLQNKNIPLWVKSFENPQEKGSLIDSTCSCDNREASLIVKEDQMLVSISTRDFSFIAENHLHTLYGILSKLKIQVNIIQNSAISFSLCFDHNNEKFDALKKELKDHFHIRYNDGLRIFTIRNYDEAVIRKYIDQEDVLLEQRSRATAQFVLKS